MTAYLIDENVLKELTPHGNVNVLAWFAGVASSDLRISAMTLFEKRRGWERRKKSDPVLASARLAELDALEAAYGDRFIPIDGPIAAEWARLLRAKDKNQRDRALAATARVRGLVLVTRNIADFRGCDVAVLDPFADNPASRRSDRMIAAEDFSAVGVELADTGGAQRPTRAAATRRGPAAEDLGLLRRGSCEGDAERLTSIRRPRCGVLRDGLWWRR